MKDQIIKEIETLSGFAFLDFQGRCKSLAYDAAIVMQQIKAKYRRILTGHFIVNELGICNRFADTFKSIKPSNLNKFDPGFKMSYLLQLQKEVDKDKTKPKKYNGLPHAKYGQGKYRTLDKRKMYT
jgi:hypothetical protein